jgi:anaerobic nitric oxide reductase flavorubredoxin
VVKTGDSLDLGNGKQLVFIETPMLHWPDSMMTYMTGDAVLFSNDAFGQHYCDERLFNDEVDTKELMDQCLRYYANILTPFSPLVTAKIKEILSLNLPVDMIATAHGVVWRDNPIQIIEQYLEWADQYQEDRITIFYDSMSNNTRMMADAIAQGIHEVDRNVAVKVFNVARHDKNEILSNAFISKGILVGSSTMNNVMMPKVAGMLEEITGLRFMNKKAAAFGSYGWTGGAIDRIESRLDDAGFAPYPSLKAKWKPDGKTILECREYGRTLAKEWALTSNTVADVVAPAANQVVQEQAISEQVEQEQAPQIVEVEKSMKDKAVAQFNADSSMLCTVCQWVYDPAQGEPNQDVAPDTAWSEVPDYFLCPECGLGKDVFEEIKTKDVA